MRVPRARRRRDRPPPVRRRSPWPSATGWSCAIRPGRAPSPAPRSSTSSHGAARGARVRRAPARAGCWPGTGRLVDADSLDSGRRLDGRRGRGRRWSRRGRAVASAVPRRLVAAARRAANEPARWCRGDAPRRRGGRVGIRARPARVTLRAAVDRRRPVRRRARVRARGRSRRRRVAEAARSSPCSTRRRSRPRTRGADPALVRALVRERRARRRRRHRVHRSARPARGCVAALLGDAGTRDRPTCASCSGVRGSTWSRCSSTSTGKASPAAAATCGSPGHPDATGGGSAVGRLEQPPAFVLVEPAPDPVGLADPERVVEALAAPGTDADRLRASLAQVAVFAPFGVVGGKNSAVSGPRHAARSAPRFQCPDGHGPPPRAGLSPAARLAAGTYSASRRRAQDGSVSRRRRRAEPSWRSSGRSRSR